MSEPSDMPGSHRSSEGLYTAEVSMSEDSTRNWTRTYVSVIIVEVLSLVMLWWLQSHYGA
jgi:hypothetical protein